MMALLDKPVLTLKVVKGCRLCEARPFQISQWDQRFTAVRSKIPTLAGPKEVANCLKCFPGSLLWQILFNSFWQSCVC